MKIVIIALACLCFMMINNTKEIANITNESLVDWLRDGHSGKRNALVQVGSFFVTERNTVYGADCLGCTITNGIGSTSSQIEVTTESVRQSDGRWKDGVTYDGYYLIASDKALPMCTVVRISNHSYEGEGIKRGIPFYALVVDRGSMIQKNTIDLFAGTEHNPSITHDGLSGAVVEIVDFLMYEKSEDGRMRCAGK